MKGNTLWELKSKEAVLFQLFPLQRCEHKPDGRINEMCLLGKGSGQRHPLGFRLNRQAVGTTPTTFN